jgi:hypothetical protein
MRHTEVFFYIFNKRILKADLFILIFLYDDFSTEVNLYHHRMSCDHDDERRVVKELGRGCRNIFQVTILVLVCTD